MVVSALDAQAYNRYSYVLNRPLVLTDPSGYEPQGFGSDAEGQNGPGQGGPGFGGGYPYGPNGVRHGNDHGQPGGTPAFTIAVTEDMCAEIAACSGRQSKKPPVYIWHAPIDDWARTAVDIGTDFIPGVGLAKAAYDAYDRIQNGDDEPVDILMAAGGDALLGLIPGGRPAKKLGKAIGKAFDKAEDVADKVEDVADAAGDVTRAAQGTQGGSRAGKRFTPNGKREIDATNAEKYGGINKCEGCGVEVVPGQRSTRGVSPPSNERQRDHIHPRSRNGDGDPSKWADSLPKV